MIALPRTDKPHQTRHAHMELATREFVRSIEVFRPSSGDAASGELVHAQGFNDGCPTAEETAPIGAAGLETFPTIQQTDDGRSTLTWPCFRGDQCRGVVRIQGDSAEGAQGAFEVWRRDDRGELGLSDSWYANLDGLGQISQYVKFPRRAGLPGLTWEDRFPRVLGEVSQSKSFVRVAAARSSGLSTALGVPFMQKSPNLDAVLLLLSTNTTPIARVIEVWARESESSALKIVSADYGSMIDLAPLSRRLTLRRGEGIAGHVYEQAAPWITQDLLGVEFPRGDRLAEYGLRVGLGVPVFIGDDLVACVNLYL